MIVYDERRVAYEYHAVVAIETKSVVPNEMSNPCTSKYTDCLIGLDLKMLE